MVSNSKKGKVKITKDTTVISQERLETKERIIAAVRDNHGLMKSAADKAGVSYQTVCNYAKDFPEVKQAIEEAKEGNLDHVEGKLFEAIDKGNIAAICFYLKTQGKGRGYIERQEIGGIGGEPIVIKEVEVRLSGN